MENEERLEMLRKMSFVTLIKYTVLVGTITTVTAILDFIFEQKLVSSIFDMLHNNGSSTF